MFWYCTHQLLHPSTLLSEAREVEEGGGHLVLADVEPDVLDLDVQVDLGRLPVRPVRLRLLVQLQLPGDPHRVQHCKGSHNLPDKGHKMIRKGTLSGFPIRKYSLPVSQQKAPTIVEVSDGVALLGDARAQARPSKDQLSWLHRHPVCTVLTRYHRSENLPLTECPPAW